MQPVTDRLSPLRFVLAFGVVSCLADFVYEGARAIVGPFLATMGASALVVGFVTGFGEAIALVLRLGTGRLSDRTGRHWALSIIGYVVTVVAVPLLALAHTLWQAALLVVTERFGKAVRTPARDTMLAQASSRTGRGRAFALHEALDQSGAVIGPLVVAAMVAVSGYRLGFGVLVVPGVAAIALLIWLRRAVPNPGAYEDSPPHAVAAPTDQRFSRRFWIYTAFTAMTNINDVLTCDQDHNYSDEQRAFDGGAMDKFVSTVGTGTGTSPTGKPCVAGDVMNYYDGNTVTGLWNYAQHYAMNDNSFAPTFEPSSPGAVNLVSGNTGGVDMTHTANSPSIPDEFKNAGFQNSVQHSSNQGICNAVHPIGAGLSSPLTPGTGQYGYKDDYIPHHQPFNYYASTANPHHVTLPTDARGSVSPKALKTIGTDTQHYVNGAPTFDNPQSPIRHE